MSLRVRASVFLALTILALVCVFAALGTRQTDQVFDALALRDARNNVGVAMRWFDDQAETVRLAAGEMAGSPAVAASVSSGDEAVIGKSLGDAALTAAGVDFVVILGDDGEVAYSRFLFHGDLADEIAAGARENSEKTEFTDQRRTRSVLIASTAGPVALGLAPVPAADGQSGDSETTLIAGRLIDAPPDAAFAEKTGIGASAITWYSPREPDLPAQAAEAADELVDSGQLVVIKEGDGNQAFDYGTVDDSKGNPVAILRVKADAAVQDARDDLLRIDLIYLLIFLLATVGALVVVLDTSVLHRLSSVLSGVRQVGSAEETAGARLPVEGHDEISDLARSVNDILETMDRQHERLQTLQTTDALTKVCNRSRFLDELRRQLEKSKRLGESGALMWFDLDHFKQINDGHGLGVGDRVLVEFAVLLSSTTRAYCTVGRLGGDDFAVLDPGADREQACRAAKRIQETVSGHVFADDGREITVGVSVGVACYPDHGASAEALLEAAENAKERSKREGGGRVTTQSAASPPAAPDAEQA